MVSNSPPAKQSACISVEQSILLDKSPIKVVSEAKFLGVIVDRTLSYSSHVNNLKTNCLQVLDILKIVGHTDWGADQKTTLSQSSPRKI